jgi:dethiobiotin synthetase
VKNYFITGIGTDVGKTIVSAVLTELLKADYWKPVQSGSKEGRDTEKVKALVSNSKSIFHNEAYVFKEPLSPHLAAKKENKIIELESIELPETENSLIIEGAGGPLVPLNENQFVIDVAKKFKVPVILVVNNYLGCINHSLLCIDFLTQQQFDLAGIILNGNFEPEVEKSVTEFKPVKVLARIPFHEHPDKNFVKLHASLIDKTMFV